MARRRFWDLRFTSEEEWERDWKSAILTSLLYGPPKWSRLIAWTVTAGLALFAALLLLVRREFMWAAVFALFGVYHSAWAVWHCKRLQRRSRRRAFVRRVR